MKRRYPTRTPAPQGDLIPSRSPRQALRSGARQLLQLLAVGGLCATTAHAASDAWVGSADALWATATNWSLGTAAPGTGEIATFNGTGNGHTTVDLGAGVTVGSVIFDTASAAAYTLGTSGQSLSLDNAGAITIQAGVTSAQTIAANLNLSAAAAATSTITNNGTGLLTVSGGVIANNVSGAGVMTVAGSGNTTITGALTEPGVGNQALLKTGSGTLTLSSGSTWSGAGAIGRIPATAAGFPLVAREGTLVLNGGTHAVGGELVIGGVVADGGAGQNAKVQVDSGSLTVSTWLSVGRGNGVGAAVSELTLNGSSTVSTVNLSAGFNGGSGSNRPKGLITLNGTSTLSVTSTGTSGFMIGESDNSDVTLVVNDNATLNVPSITDIRAIAIGKAGGKGTLTMNGGTANFRQLDIGTGNNSSQAANGTVTVNTGATLNSEGDVRLGFAGSAAARAALNINGGAVNIGTATKRWLVVGRWDSTQSTVNMTGGQLNLNTNTDIRFCQDSNIGPNVFTLSDGNITSYSDNRTTALGAGVVDLMLTGNTNNAGSNTFNLNGGVLTVRGVNATQSRGTRIFNFNGGRLKATGDSTTFVKLGTGTARANVRNGGALIDTDSYTLTITDPLLHSDIVGDASKDGGLTKFGTGSLTLTGLNTYTGDTTINDGSLTLADNATMKFLIGASGTNTRVTGAGSFTVDGDFEFDLTNASTTVGDSWQIVDAAALNETFGTTFNVPTFVNETGKWVKPANGAFYEFDTATGVLRVITDPGVVIPPPTVNLGTYNSEYPVNSDFTLSVSALGSGTLSYQWYYQANAGATPVAISGATSSSYAITGATTGATGIYSVVVTDSAAPTTPTTATFPVISVLPVADLVVAYYRFEEGADGSTVTSALDSVGSNHLTAEGTVTVDQSNVPLAAVPATGAANVGTVSFPTSGSNGLVAPTTGTLADTDFADITAECWVRFSDLSGANQTLIGRDDDLVPGYSGGGDALLYLQRVGGNAVKIIAADKSGVLLTAQSGGNVFAVGNWYHVAVVGNHLDGSLKIYVDGSQVASVTGFTGLKDPDSGSDTPWTIGRGDWNLGNVDFVKGQIDEVRFTRAALKPSQFLNTANGVLIRPPTASISPSGITAPTGGSVSFTATAASQLGGTLSYEWYHNGSLLSGQTASTLSLTNLTLDSNGTYSVVVTDSQGTTLGVPISTTTSVSVRVLNVPAAGTRAIGLNFVGSSTGGLFSTELGPINTGETAGFYASGNWNNSATTNFVATQLTPLALTESNGSSVAGVSATWSSANTWSARATTGLVSVKSPDAKLLHGYIESRATTGATVTVANIPYASYDVYVYVAGGGSGTVGSVTVSREGAPTYYFKVLQHDAYVPAITPTAEAPYSLIPMIGEAADRAAALAAAPATFVRFTGLTGADLTITAKDQTLNSNAGGIAAIQIVDTTPAGTPYPPIVSSSLSNRLVKAGTQVALSVTALPGNVSGVLTYAWSKGVDPIPGATSATLDLGAVDATDSGNYSVTITETSAVGVSTATRSADLVVVGPGSPVLINADFNSGSSTTATGNGILRADGTSAYTDFGSGTTVWNALSTGSGSATQTLPRESTGLAVPLTVTYSNAGGGEDNILTDAIADSPALNLMRDYLWTDNQTTPLSLSVGGLQDFVGHEVTLLVYAYGKGSTSQEESTTNDAATVTLAAANNHLNSAASATSTYLTGFLSTNAGRRVDVNNLIYTTANPGVSGQPTAAYVTYTGVVAQDGTVAWTLGADTDGGRIAINGFQLLLTDTNLGPAAPTGVAAVAGDNQVGLSWNAVSGTTSYTIRRGTTSGSYSILISGTVTGTSYTDATAVNGTTYYYTVAAANGVLVGANSAEVSATPVLSATALELWRSTHFGSTANSGNGADSADPDNDGQANLLEYALGQDPTVASAYTVTLGRSADHLTLTFNHGADASLIYSIEASDDLATWSTVQTYPAFSVAGSSTYTDTAVSVSTQPRRFLRLRVALAP